MVQNAYMELHSGSKNVAVVVRNSTAYPQTLRKKTPWQGQLQLVGYQKSHTDQFDRGIGGGPWPSDAQVKCEAMVRETHLRS